MQGQECVGPGLAGNKRIGSHPERGIELQADRAARAGYRQQIIGADAQPGGGEAGNVDHIARQEPGDDIARR